MNKNVYTELKRVYWNTSQDRNILFFSTSGRRLEKGSIFIRCSQQSHQCLKGRNWRNGFGGTGRGTKTPIFTKWNKLFRNACKDHGGHGGGRKERSVRYYFAAAWECYTYEYRSVPSSVALLSISLHLSRVLFTRLPPSYWLADFYCWELIWSEMRASVCKQGGSIHPDSISIYNQGPLWEHSSEERLQSL